MTRADRRARNRAVNDAIARHLAEHDPHDERGRIRTEHGGLVGCAVLALIGFGSACLAAAFVLALWWLWVHA